MSNCVLLFTGIQGETRFLLGDRFTRLANQMRLRAAQAKTNFARRMSWSPRCAHKEKKNDTISDMKNSGIR